MLGWGSLHSRVIRSSVGENVLNFHLCARRGCGGPGPGRRGAQGLKVVTALQVGFATAETWPALGGGSATHGRLEEADGPILLTGLSCPPPPPPLGSFQRLLGPGSISVLQEISPSWLLSAGLHLQDDSPSSPTVWTPSPYREGQDSCAPETPRQPGTSASWVFGCRSGT